MTSEPYAIAQQGGFKPNVFLAADFGYQSYSTTIETRRDLIEKNPDLVRRFVEASIIGWYHYLYGDNAKANALIRQDNPDITDGQLAYSIAALRKYGIVDSGDAQKLGIGAMTDARMKAFFAQMVAAKLFKPDLDYKKAYTLAFVDHGVGLGPAPEAMNETLVALSGIAKTYPNGTRALDGLDLAVREGELLTLLGPSGCGKSTVLRLIAGLERPSSGEVQGAVWRPGDIGFVFQEATLMPWADVAANVELPLRLQKLPAPRRANAATRFSRSSASRNSPKRSRANFPAACGCAFRLPARSRRGPNCC